MSFIMLVFSVPLNKNHKYSLVFLVIYFLSPTRQSLLVSTSANLLYSFGHIDGAHYHIFGFFDTKTILVEPELRGQSTLEKINRRATTPLLQT